MTAPSAGTQMTSAQSSGIVAEGEPGDVASLRAHLTSMLEAGETFRRDAQDALRRLDASALSPQEPAQAAPDAVHNSSISGARVGAISVAPVSQKIKTDGQGALHMASIAGKAL